MKFLKNILSTSILVIYAILFCSISLSANDSKNSSYCTEQDPEAIQMQKIAFYTSELKLTTKEAEKFWPLYNEYWDARMRAHKEAIKAIRKLNKVLEGETTTVSDTEIKQLSEAYLKNYSAESALLNEYFIKFQDILPINKAAKIFSTEEKFRRMLIKQLRNKPQHKSNTTPPMN